MVHICTIFALAVWKGLTRPPEFSVLLMKKFMIPTVGGGGGGWGVPMSHVDYKKW